MKNSNKIILAILAAALYGISAPASKILLDYINPLFMAALLYIGAGTGMLIYHFASKAGTEKTKEASLTKKELPYLAAIILLDIIAPILMLLGLQKTTAGTASLLNNFEIAATSIIALVFFKEAIGKRQWVAMALIIAASAILTFSSGNEVHFSFGSLYILLACLSWGVENNCTRQISLKDPVQIVIIKGLGSGIGALIACAAWGEFTTDIFYIACALILGFVSYGLSILFYVFAQRSLGAVRTSIYYSIAPFIGVILSWIILRESISASFIAALFLMMIAAYMMASELHNHAHIHELQLHEHKHRHDDGHHDHVHEGNIEGYHSHEHQHEKMEHSHSHYPDEHHRHRH
ncbi:MAG: DMT family transporter [Clostridia bacterium]|nr:DMT family transporter [Clostridia bacterium]